MASIIEAPSAQKEIEVLLEEGTHICSAALGYGYGLRTIGDHLRNTSPGAAATYRGKDKGLLIMKHIGSILVALAALKEFIPNFQKVNTSGITQKSSGRLGPTTIKISTAEQEPESLALIPLKPRPRKIPVITVLSSSQDFWTRLHIHTLLAWKSLFQISGNCIWHFIKVVPTMASIFLAVFLSSFVYLLGTNPGLASRLMYQIFIFPMQMLWAWSVSVAAQAFTSIPYEEANTFVKAEMTAVFQQSLALAWCSASVIGIIPIAYIMVKAGVVWFTQN